MPVLPPRPPPPLCWTTPALQQSSPIGAVAARPAGVLTCLKAMVDEGGIARLYRGFGLTLLRAGPVSGVLLPLFDITLAALEKLSATARARRHPIVT